MEIWTEKYRPKKLDEVVGQEKLTKRLKSFVEKKSIPHLLFSGPAGIGKTTAAIALAHELYGEGWKNNYMELNASDERGIDVIRNKVKNFARTKTLAKAGYKIICLDEADALTPEAQQALRRTMEKYTNTARFIIVCNYSSKIIDPIQSRCVFFRFKPVEEEKVKKLLKNISKKEGLEVDEEALDSVLYISKGDLRKAINLLQGTASFENINKKTVFEVAGKAEPKDVKEMVEMAKDKKFSEARDKLYNLIITQGVSGEDLIKEIHKQVKSLDIEDEKRLNIIERVGEVEFRLSEGSDPLIQIESLLAKIGIGA